MKQFLLIFALLLGAALSGCLANDEKDVITEGQPPTQSTLPSKLFEIASVEEVWVNSAQDGKRINNQVYRPLTEDPVGVFINFSPYWGDTAEIRGDAFSTYMIEEYVTRGFAVVLSAVRGTGHSEGCFQIGGDLELQDSYDVIDFFANQDWSNGRVAAGGKSYDSTTQNGVIAKFPHEALKGIFHVSGITDMYRYNYREGVTYTSGVIFNSYYYLQGVDEYGLSFLSTPSPTTLNNEDPESLARIIDDAACTELPDMQVSGVGSGVTGIRTPYWQERNYIDFVSDTAWDGKIFFVHGLQDYNVKPDHIDDFIAALPEQIEVYGWLHQDQQGGTGHVYPMRADWNYTMLVWLDELLNGNDHNMPSGPWQSMGTDMKWRQSSSWPPVGTELEIPTTEAKLISGPARVAGQLKLNVSVTAQTPDGVASAVFYDVGPDGEMSWVTEAVLRLNLDNNLQPNPYAPGSSMNVQLVAYPIDLILEEGHHLAVVMGGAPTQSLVLPTQTQVAYGAGTVIALQVPIGGLLNPQPESTICFTC